MYAIPHIYFISPILICLISCPLYVFNKQFSPLSRTTQTAQRNAAHQNEDKHAYKSTRHQEDDDDGPVVVDTVPNDDDFEQDEIPEELRTHLPMSFGSSKPQDLVAARAQIQQRKQLEAEKAVLRKANDNDDAFVGGVRQQDNDDEEQDDDEDIGPMPEQAEEEEDMPISSEISLKGKGLACVLLYLYNLIVAVP